MNKLLDLRPLWMLLIYIVLDIVCVGMGMGVPIFCILFGFIVGWFLVKAASITNGDILGAMQKVLRSSILTAGITFVAMLVLWVPFARNLFDPSVDLSQTGIPMILYEPRASFIGWIVLMVIISPFLQLLTTQFSAYLTILVSTKKDWLDQKTV
jgi:hypothetical protein